jgi:hypothetical protein
MVVVLYIALHGHFEVLELLLKHPNRTLSIDAKDSCGVTPVMDAVATDNVNLAKYLIEHYQVTEISYIYAEWG